MTNEFEANLGEIRREKRKEQFYEPSTRQEYQRPKREEDYLPQEPINTKEALILFFVITSILVIFIMFGIFLNQVSKDKFKSITDVEQKVEPKIDVYSNSTTNNQFNITSPIVNYFNITLVNNIYLNWTGNNS